MTGFYVRIMREGRAQNVEIEALTDDEFAELAGTNPEAGWRWAAALARWIRDHVAEGAPARPEASEN